jgi:putative membrane protein
MLDVALKLEYAHGRERGTIPMSEDSKVVPADHRITDPRVMFATERTEMAALRVSLAIDRTTLAWIRTTLSMSSFGLGMIGFFRSLREHAETPESIRLHEGAIHFGVVLVVMGVVASVLVAISHMTMLRKLRAGETPVPVAWPLSITISLLLSLLAVGGLWIVFGR